jgi:large subunit ribosomal protein L24
MKSRYKHGRAPRLQMGIRKGDMVRVISGRDREQFATKSSRVLSVNAVKGTVIVEHAQMIKRHTRPNPQKNIKGGIVEREASINVSNVMLVCPACNGATRGGHAVHVDGNKQVRKRTCRRCSATIDK